MTRDTAEPTEAELARVVPKLPPDRLVPWFVTSGLFAVMLVYVVVTRGWAPALLGLGDATALVLLALLAGRSRRAQWRWVLTLLVGVPALAAALVAPWSWALPAALVVGFAMWCLGGWYAGVHGEATLDAGGVRLLGFGRFGRHHLPFDALGDARLAGRTVLYLGHDGRRLARHRFRTPEEAGAHFTELALRLDRRRLPPAEGLARGDASLEQWVDRLERVARGALRGADPVRGGEPALVMSEARRRHADPAASDDERAAAAYLLLRTGAIQPAALEVGATLSPLTTVLATLASGRRLRGFGEARAHLSRADRRALDHLRSRGTPRSTPRWRVPEVTEGGAATANEEGELGRATLNADRPAPEPLRRRA